MKTFVDIDGIFFHILEFYPSAINIHKANIKLSAMLMNQMISGSAVSMRISARQEICRRENVSLFSF